MLATEGLLARVGPHVLLELRWVAEALGALHANVRKVLAVHSQQMAVQETLFGRLVLAILTLVQLGLLVSQDEFVGAERACLVIAARVLRVLWDLFVLDDELVAFQMVVETHLLVGGEVTVGALVLLLKNVVRVVLHVPFEEASRLELLAADVAGVDGEGLSIRTNNNSGLALA